MINVALGGRIAEDIFFGKVTTGAGDDIKKVTQIAQGIVMTYGMTDKMGLVAYNSGGESSMKAYSDETNHEIDMEVKRIVDECYANTKELLESKRHLIEALAEELLEHESINLPKIIKVLGDRPFPMKESLKEYLSELTDRERKDAEEKAKKAEDDEVNAAEQAMNTEDATDKTDATEGAETEDAQTVDGQTDKTESVESAKDEDKDESKEETKEDEDKDESKEETKDEHSENKKKGE